MTSKQFLYDISDFVMQQLEGYDASVTVQATSDGLTRFGNSEINKNVYEDLVKETILTENMFNVLTNAVDVSLERERTRWWYPLTSYYLPAFSARTES